MNFKATLERVRAAHAAICISIADVVRATEGDRDTVKRAEKSVDRDGNGEGDGHGHRGAYYVCGPADRHGARVTAHTSARRRRRQSAPADAFRVH